MLLAIGFAGIVVLMGMGILKKRKFKATIKFFGFNFEIDAED